MSGVSEGSRRRWAPAPAATGETRVLDASAMEYDGLTWQNDGGGVAVLRGEKPAGKELKQNVLLASDDARAGRVVQVIDLGADATDRVDEGERCADLAEHEVEQHDRRSHGFDRLHDLGVTRRGQHGRLDAVAAEREGERLREQFVIVDDDEASRYIKTRVLESQGFDVVDLGVVGEGGEFEFGQGVEPAFVEAAEVADALGRPTRIFPPANKAWSTGYKPRNMRIAEVSASLPVRSTPPPRNSPREPDTTKARSDWPQPLSTSRNASSSSPMASAKASPSPSTARLSPPTRLTASLARPPEPAGPRK